MASADVVAAPVAADPSIPELGVNAGQIGVLVRSVLEGLGPAVEAAVRQQLLPAPVAVDSRSSTFRAPVVDPSVFGDTERLDPEANISGYGALPAVGFNPPSIACLRARAQALEYVDLSEFLMAESTLRVSRFSRSMGSSQSALTNQK